MVNDGVTGAETLCAPRASKRCGEGCCGARVADDLLTPGLCWVSFFITVSPTSGYPLGKLRKGCALCGRFSGSALEQPSSTVFFRQFPQRQIEKTFTSGARTAD